MFPLSSVTITQRAPAEDPFLALSQHFCSRHDLPPPPAMREREKPLRWSTNLYQALSILVLYQQICTTLESGLGYM